MREPAVILAALPEELQALREAVATLPPERRPELVLSGVGKVQAAAATADVLARRRPSIVLNVGVAGGLAPELGIGDLVVADAVVQHDVDLAAFGHPPGVLPEVDTRIPVDRTVVDGLLAAARAVAPHVRAVAGLVATGDQFISDESQKARLHGRFGALAVEMEAAAIGFVARARGVPFGVLRSLSDAADGKAARDFDAFVHDASRTAAQVVTRFLLELG
jgi:5'-methylthioadenosine/S-adenosylhomocysteine nucleosidase